MDVDYGLLDNDSGKVIRIKVADPSEAELKRILPGPVYKPTE
jgi:hypothetical protein